MQIAFVIQKILTFPRCFKSGSMIVCPQILAIRSSIAVWSGRSPLTEEI